VTVIPDPRPGVPGGGQCSITDQGGRCIRDAIVRIVNADANPGDAKLERLSCHWHISRALQEAAAAGHVPHACFAVEPVGRLARRIEALVPVPRYLT
jgi:hypothetical protein